MNILFLGAGKRLSLLESFLRAGEAEGVQLRLSSVEDRAKVPISTVAEIHVGPSFLDPQFCPWLMELTRRLAVDMVIPNMDAATVAVSAIHEELSASGAWSVASSHALCTAMWDKVSAERWFVDHGIPVPGRRSWPRLFKYRRGFGGKGQTLIRNERERQSFLATVDVSDYLEQEFLEGPEFSVDIYVARTGQLLAAMSRRRLKICDGEVEESLSERHEEVLELVRRIASEPGWQGPLTAQFIVSAGGPVAIEINPRFGGGVTHAIHCGLDFPRWLLRERLGRPLPSSPQWVEGSLMSRCRRDVFL